MLEFDLSDPSNLLQTYTHLLPWTAVSLYLLMVFFLPRLCPRNLNSRLLKHTMVAWNLFLTVLSVAMLLGMSVPLLSTAWNRGFVETVCDEDHSLFKPAPIVFWLYLFVLSKFAELLDTVFLILKKPERPVEFLHYFHHATVLPFSWYSLLYSFSVGYWFAIINATIHTFMYFYYALTELGYKPQWAPILTACQILQMVAGIALNTLWFKQYYFDGKRCNCGKPMIIFVACALMYGSYLYLFGKFFVKKYIKVTAAGRKKAE